MSEWHGGGHMMGMWLWWILGLVVIVLLIWLVTRLMAQGTGDSANSPEQDLKRRFARGEIDQEEYNSRLKELRR